MDKAARRWNRVYAGLYLVYLVIGLAGRLSGWHGFDEAYWLDAARHVLDGSWRLYEFRIPGSIPAVPPLGITYSYSPLLALLLAPFVALADALRSTPLALAAGGADRLANVLIVLPLLAADVLAMQEFRRLCRVWRPAVDETALFLGVLLMLFGTGFLQVSAVYAHHEGLLLLLLLLTIRLTPTRPLLGGLCAGLSLAAKQTTALVLLPIGLALLLGGSEPGDSPAGRRRRPVYTGIVWGGVALAVFALFMLPAVLADPDAVIYAFITLPTRLVLFDPGLPGWLDAGLAAVLHHGTPEFRLWHGWILQYSNPVLLLTVLAANSGIFWWSRRHGAPIRLVDTRLLALIALSASLPIVLGKWVGEHYYQVPLALVLLWDTVRSAPRWPAVGFGAAVGFRVLSGLPWPGLPLLSNSYLAALFSWLAGALLAAATVPSRVWQARRSGPGR